MKNFSRHAAVLSLLCAASALLPASPGFAAISPVESTALPNGSTLLVRGDKIAPRVGISLLVRVGAADETAENAGWRQVLASAILRATRLEASGNGVARFSDWQARMEKWGGQIGATVDDDSIEFWATGDSAHTRELMQTLLQIVLQPRLADEDLAGARRRVLSLQSQSGNTIAARATQSISRQLYRDAKDTPLAYALPDFGTFESLSSFTDEQLRNWHAQYFVPSRLLVGASGDVNVALLKTELERLASTPAAASSTPDTVPSFGALKAGLPPLVVREMGEGGAWVFTSFRTPAPGVMTARETAALQVLSAALEGSSLSRLPRRLLGDTETPFNPNAESNALAAQTASQWTTRRYAGELTVFAQTGPQNVEAVKNALLDEIRKLRDTPLSAAELQSAKDFARGQWAVGRDSLHERAFETALTALHSTTPDSKWPEYFQNVSAPDVQQVAQKYLRDYAVVLIMPQE